MAEWESVAQALVEERYGALVGYARVVTGASALAEDIVQEALIATFSRPRGLANVTVAETYVRRAIVSRFIDSTRKPSHRFAADAELADHAAEGSHADAIGTATDLRAALALLSARERACVVLRYLENLSVKETATVLGLAEGSVKRYVSDGIARLNAVLGTDDSDDDAALVRAANGGAR